MPEVVDACLAVLPIGSFDQHGPHLPLATDILIAVAIASGISDQYGALQLPPVPFSCSDEHADFAGTASVRATTLAAIVNDVAQSLERQGIHRLLIGTATVATTCSATSSSRPPSKAARGWGSSRPGRTGTKPARPRYDQRLPRGHARGEPEVSILMAAFPDAVREGWNQDDHTANGRRHLGVLGMSAYTKSGVIGRPSVATPEKGRAALDHLVGAAQHSLKILDETSNER
jgi:creatinine amidohydrolase